MAGIAKPRPPYSVQVGLVGDIFLAGLPCPRISTDTKEKKENDEKRPSP